MTKQTQEQGRERSERDKDTIRREIVAYLNKFNADNYPAIEPLLRRAKMDFFAIARGNAVPGADACSSGYTQSYYVLLGRNPQVAVYHCGGWTYPLVSKQEVSEVFDLGLGEIRLSRKKDASIIDVAETAWIEANQDSNVVEAYKQRVEADYTRYLDFFRGYVACREDKK